MLSPYSHLCTEFYDLTKPEAEPRELAFYEPLLRKAQGPLLEAMCGSGRLLIPLLKKGIPLEGVDSSSHMLESCQKRCQTQGLHTPLYHQSLQNLHLPKKYGLIFIAIGSFQLLSNRQEALLALQTLRSALLPGGALVLETFVPWEAFRENIEGSSLPNRSKPASYESRATAPDGSSILHKATVTLSFEEQLERTKSRYEKWIGATFRCAEEEEYTVRWYHRFEMELFLEKAGFSAVEIVDASFERNEQAVIYVMQEV